MGALGMDPKASSASSQPSSSQSQGAGPMDPKFLAMAGIDSKMLAGMDPKVLASYGIDAKMLAQMDPKSYGQQQSNSSSSSSKLVAGMDPKMLAAAGIDPKMLEGMDPKMLASMGLDAKSLSAAMDPKNIAKSMAMDPKMLQSMGMDPKMLASMGIDPKMMASMGLDGKGGMDPKMMAGMDPKMLAGMGMDPKMLAGMGMDPKMLQSMGIDPKMMAGMDPKMLASMGMDPKMMSDPNLMAMYAMGMPGMMPPMTSGSSMTNGIGSSGTPLPSSKGNLSAKPKPGTVAAALQEKKESEKSRSEHGGDDMYDNHDRSNSDAEVGSEEDFRRGLTSEERVLLREKKKERLMKENESEQNDEGLNLSVSKNGGSEHTTKLEALLAKPIDDMPHHGDKGMHNTNGEPPRTEGV